MVYFGSSFSIQRCTSTSTDFSTSRTIASLVLLSLSVFRVVKADCTAVEASARTHSWSFALQLLLRALFRSLSLCDQLTKAGASFHYHRHRSRSLRHAL
ncbi:hypothetical protein PF011_g8103 [Phytophthora fragariae]|uniref:RxLR effector protein n=1 Tax=Phytophthora fragariae TaxID=53985 RepID=A0A6A3L5N1_9STRA|nr:hypothetical protein PF011_g8103 [Phytophthora fragariae]